MPILWIGLLLVFLRQEGYIRRWEIGILKFLSWFCLVLGITYLILTPMLIGNTARLYRIVDTQIESKTFEQTEKVKKAREQVVQAKDQDVLTYLKTQQPNLPASITPKQFKENLLLQADRNISELRANAATFKFNQISDLIKKTVKWSLGFLFSAFVCAWIWYLTRWTRLKNL